MVSREIIPFRKILVIYEIIVSSRETSKCKLSFTVKELLLLRSAWINY